MTIEWLVLFYYLFTGGYVFLAAYLFGRALHDAVPALVRRPVNRTALSQTPRILYRRSS